MKKKLEIRRLKKKNSLCEEEKKKRRGIRKTNKVVFQKKVSKGIYMCNTTKDVCLI